MLFFRQTNFLHVHRLLPLLWADSGAHRPGWYRRAGQWQAPIRSHLSQPFQAQFDKVPGVLKTLRSEIFRVGFRLILCKPVGWVERHGNVGSLHWCVFWCWWNVIGFLRTVGYTGGRNPKPSYETVCGGDGHTEVSHQSGFSFSWALKPVKEEVFLNVDLPRKCTSNL